jgi:hypothetical protein
MHACIQGCMNTIEAQGSVFTTDVGTPVEVVGV